MIDMILPGLEIGELASKAATSTAVISRERRFCILGVPAPNLSPVERQKRHATSDSSESKAWPIEIAT
tara:strand:+ start:337 stop:540 length:204 start_codon:yes stop_codon:yes gene_type:complete